MNTTLLYDLLSQPTAPFCEKWVIETLKGYLSAHRVPYFQDPIGNLVIGAASKKVYLKLLNQHTHRKPEPLRIFIAHLDHPGFHGIQWIDTNRFEFKWHGGAPTHDLKNAPVWISTHALPKNEKLVGHGTIQSATLTSSAKSIDRGILEIGSQDFPEALKKIPAKNLWGGFSFKEMIWKENSLYYTKAADDLIGAFAIVSLAIEAFSKPNKKSLPFIGLLTRAEEVGFIGCIGHFELGWIQPKKHHVLAVSLETSRTLPGADIGKGPVLRQGDRAGVFSSEALYLFEKLAMSEKILFQKRVMDGGTCEATAAMSYGLPTVGISVPLGNYHNQNFDGGPPAPEYVHEDDVKGLIELCRALLKPSSKFQWKNPWSERKKSFQKSLKSYHTLLKTGHR